jgi:ACT domain-containing protein
LKIRTLFQSAKAFTLKEKAVEKMIVEMKANLPDHPGTLVKMLIPIKENLGNIQSIVHDHDLKISNKVPVHIKFDLPDEDGKIRMEKIKNAIEAEGIEVVKLAEDVLFEYLNVILIGHVFDNTFEDTFSRITAQGAIIDGIDSIFTDPSEVSTVYFEIHYPSLKVKRQNIIKTLKEICNQKNFALITD